MGLIRPPGGLTGTLLSTFAAAAVFAVGGRAARAADPAGTPSITVHAYDEDTTHDRAEAIERSSGEQLSHDARFLYKPFSSLLEPVEDVPRLLGQADIQVLDADKAFGEMSLDDAKKLLGTALDTYKQYLPQLGARGAGTEPMRDAYIKLSKTRFFDGDNDGARDALRYVFVLDKTTTFNPKTFPPQMKKTVVEAKLLFSTLGTGKLAIDSDPQGAEVWLNGQKLEKVTPCEAEAAAGPNFVSFRLRGYTQITAVAEVKGEGETSTVVQALARPPGNAMGGINQARLKLDEPHPPAALRESMKSLGQEMILLFRFGKHEEADGSVHTELTAYLYDARPDRVINKKQRSVLEPEAPKAAADMTREVTSGIRLDGIWAPPPPPKKPSGTSIFFGNLRTKMVDFYHWKGFWYVVGGVAAAAVIGTAVGVGVAVQQQQTAQQLVLLGGH